MQTSKTGGQPYCDTSKAAEFKQVKQELTYSDTSPYEVKYNG